MQAGKNTLQIILTSADGKPVSGLQVNASFFMPAMPQMGMAAMHAAAALSDQGGGHFAGNIDIPMGGTWQVTVSVTRGGQLVATKKLSVTTSGGM